MCSSDLNASPDDYYNVNILPYIRIPNTQDTVKNYICFSINDIEENQYNESMKEQQVQFLIFCHGDDIDTGLGIARHDLLGYFVRDIFNWSNMLGLQLKLIYDQESTLETHYSCLTIKFEATKPNHLQKGARSNRFESTRR